MEIINCQAKKCKRIKNNIIINLKCYLYQVNRRIKYTLYKYSNFNIKYNVNISCG